MSANLEREVDITREGLQESVDTISNSAEALYVMKTPGQLMDDYKNPDLRGRPGRDWLDDPTKRNDRDFPGYRTPMPMPGVYANSMPAANNFYGSGKPFGPRPFIPGEPRPFPYRGEPDPVGPFGSGKPIGPWGPFGSGKPINNPDMPFPIVGLAFDGRESFYEKSASLMNRMPERFPGKSTNYDRVDFPSYDWNSGRGSLRVLN